MKSKQEAENLRKMSVRDLSRERIELGTSLANMIPELAESGQKSSNKVRALRKKIARVETIILEKIDEQPGENKEKNV